MKKVYKTSLTKRKQVAKYNLKNREQYLKSKKESTQRWNLKNPGRRIEICKAWVAKNPEKYLRMQRKSRVKKYSLTLEQFEAMIKKQKGKCKGCGKSFPKDRAPAIDHNRKCCSGNKSCGKCIRGLLCRHCNTGIGLLKENIKTLKSFIVYLGGKL